MLEKAKQFAQRLNHCLDETDAPISMRERAVILSRMLDIPKHLAWSMIEGHLLPEPDLMVRIANEFEVDLKWLSGNK